MFGADLAPRLTDVRTEGSRLPTDCDSPETGMASGSHTDPRSIGSNVGLARNPVYPPCTSVRRLCCFSPFWRFLESVTQYQSP
jgi:hypothetical protein